MQNGCNDEEEANQVVDDTNAIFHINLSCALTLHLSTIQSRVANASDLIRCSILCVDRCGGWAASRVLAFFLMIGTFFGTHVKTSVL